MTKKAGTQGGSQNNATAWTKRSAGPYGALLIALITLFFSGGCEIDISELYGELDWGTLLGNLQVVYDLNGGGGEPPVDSERYTRNSTVTTQPEPAEVEPPAGAVSFYGWSTSPDGYGQFYATDTTFTITEDTTLYALWNGDGTSPEYPKLVSTKQDLIDIQANDNIALVSDIDDMDEVILPAGFFQGTFDGRGHTVTLNIDKSGNVTQRQIGLFRAITSGCVIQNLHVAGSITIDDTNQNTSLFIGGIMGNMWQPGVTLKNCVSSVNMTVTSPTSNLAVGGLIGIAANGITIEHCYARGTISVSATISSSMTRYGVGGIVGVIGNSLESAVVTGGFSNSVSLAGISGGRSPPEAFTSTTMGVRRILGIVASYITNEVTFSNNYALGTVTITDFTGPVSTQPANADRDGIPAAANDIDSETWWRTTAGWESVWGGDNPTLDAPWVWDSTAKRPKLYKFD